MLYAKCEQSGAFYFSMSMVSMGGVEEIKKMRGQSPLLVAAFLNSFHPFTTTSGIRTNPWNPMHWTCPRSGPSSDLTSLSPLYTPASWCPRAGTTPLSGSYGRLFISDLLQKPAQPVARDSTHTHLSSRPLQGHSNYISERTSSPLDSQFLYNEHLPSELDLSAEPRVASGRVC